MKIAHVAAAQRLRRFLQRRVEVLQHRLHGAHDEGQAGEAIATMMPSGV